MKHLVDIVNFNSDASCLHSGQWMNALAGGKSSRLYRWVELHVKYRRKVVLGFTGGTLADIRAYNPEVLELMNANADIFGTVLRPFAHDIHLLRSPASFAFNVDLGRRAQRLALPDLRPPACYLPPEFMLTGEQVGVLAEMGLSSVLINASRFAVDSRDRIPASPYMLRGLLGVRLGCLPIDGDLTIKYLQAMQGYDSALWHAAVTSCRSDPALLWRDGESSFLLEDGFEREHYWLAHESPEIRRCTLHEWTPPFASEEKDELIVDHFPVHSFAAWMKEFRMFGFLGRLTQYEDVSSHSNAQETALWLGLINSDVLSAVEKRPVRVALRKAPASEVWGECVLHRSRREFEAEEYLALIGRLRSGSNAWDYVRASSEPHMRKLQARALVVQELVGR